MAKPTKGDLGDPVGLVEDLPGDDDVTLLVLKGLILVEETMYAAVKSLVPQPKALDDADLPFSKFVSVARAIVPEAWSDPAMWNGALLLNQIRNKIAHQLEPEVLPLIDQFMATVPPPGAEGAGIKKLGHSIGWLVGAFAALNTFAIHARSNRGSG